MRKTLVLAVSAAALIAAALTMSAFAEGGGPPGEHDGRHGGMLFQFDANHDDVVTHAEFDAGRAAQFTQADTNHDGVLSHDEVRAMRRGMHEGHDGEHGDHHGGRGEHLLDRADANHDGRITREEFLAGPNRMFDHLDANHDGVLSGDEREFGGHGRMGERLNMDADHNGTISRAEFNAFGDRMFDRLDANHDGRVTRQEAEAARPMGPPPEGGPPPR